jgi:GAF domain-containing protein
MIFDEGLTERLKAAVSGSVSRAAAAKRAAEIIREACGYRWVGMYEVGREEVVALGGTGSEPPVYTRFRVTQGITGAAIATREAVNVGDVRKDPRYLTAFGSTRSELIVPVLDASGRVVGTLDVESERENAFGEKDIAFLQRCGEVILPLFGQSAQVQAAG